jgi:hypothetical protein
MAWEEFPHSLGQTRKSAVEIVRSGLPLRADSSRTSRHVGFVPEADIQGGQRRSSWGKSPTGPGGSKTLRACRAALQTLASIMSVFVCPALI